MPQVTFQFPPKTGEAGRGLIKAFRFGLVMQGGSRIVIDLARPARIDKAFVLDAANDQPARLVARPRGQPTARPSCAPSRSTTARRSAAASRRADAGGRARRSAPAGRDRSRPWRHRQRHQGGERGNGEDHRPRVLADAARQDRKDRQIPRAHDPHRRHLRGARRSRPVRARAPGRAVHLDPCRCAAAPGGRRPGRDRLHPLGARLGRRAPRAWPRPRTRPT